MSPPDRKEDAVRRMLDGPHPLVPPGLTARAVARGERTLAHRRFVRALAVVLGAVAVLVLVAWGVVAQPWLPPPASTTPPLEGW